MSLHPKGKRGKNDPAYATWDHVYPRSHIERAGKGGVQLLACGGCNHARGQKPPTAAYMALGERLLDEWRAFAVTQQPYKTKKQRKREKRGVPICVRPRYVGGRSLDQEREFMQAVRANADAIDARKQLIREEHDRNAAMSARARSILSTLRGR